ncbi:lytic murein transglycosylase [Aliiroseovarius sp. S1339]|uniref:lytic murein transglycosylase n=1 Tax=Aliiroseovarius sp. S1339 TaxID=2936990 RepID=UPI0020C10F7C|nr:lytic murein transglycosylase [Aliiroseovarius sp. S1339]MCK8464692.1 lytic murein transglycosylase [Aliiroseovarius sp. S1339]
MDWRQGFHGRARQAGLSAQTLELCASYLRLEPRIHEKQSNQAEFTLTISQYVNRAVPESRIRKGRAQYRANRDLLNRISAKYSVDAQVILAIWGIETNYGATRGDWSVLSALATLAHAGHRASFFEEQLIAALEIIEAGDIAPAAMLGSWAGAMGHGQFIPTSFQQFAVDNDGDGRRDIWGDDPEDGLASIANYLAQHGWQMSRPCRVEVQLPKGFDFERAGLQTKRPVPDWSALGVVAADGAPVPDYGESSVLLPSGARGPAFLTFTNFDVLRTYNRADAYVIAVGCLADRLQGGKPIVKQCPDDLVILKRDEMRELQERLINAGYDTLGADGFFGPNTAKALRSYQKDHGLVADGFGSGAMLDHLRAKTG